jgi:pectinesterase
MGGHILAAGWDNWRNVENEKTAYYAEYESRGEGAAAAQRVSWSKQLTAREARKYTAENILGNWVVAYISSTK